MYPQTTNKTASLKVNRSCWSEILAVRFCGLTCGFKTASIMQRVLLAYFSLESTQSFFSFARIMKKGQECEVCLIKATP